MALNRCGLTHCSLVPLYVWSSSGRRGTIKRYGIGADVLIMLGGLNEAVTGADATKARALGHLRRSGGFSGRGGRRRADSGQF
jgi:hypothetical protein